MKKILRFLRNKKIKLFSDLAKNKKIIFVFLLIFFLGIFLRVYHHRDWLLFHLDQSRDALIVSEAIENGPTHLPLHGPHASSTGLKEKIYLGPIFYYFQYFFALVFGYAPNILAWPDLFFSILSICLFYLFTRKYFSVPISLSLMLIFSCSFFLIIYGRFAWNPNATLFFMLLMLLSLANMAEKKTSRSLIWWFLLAAFSMSVLIQLHFITFFLAPFIFLLFLIWQRKVISLKLFLAGAVMICLISLPVIVNEHQSDWKNFGNLRSSILGKMKGSDKKDIPGEKIIESVQKISFYGWAGISADEKLEPLKVYRKKSGMPALKCSDEFR
jgi:4-amino-4-deoxy-L-arabinose transferase-like glycosyltransferase